MSAAHIRFSTEILRRLGEELNPSLERGIIELVKNAYDADARECRVVLRDAGSPGGTITVTDDGDGMDQEAIRNGWLVLGSSPKSAGRRTRLGRVPTGSKGLGRLAALRMGHVAELSSFPTSNPREYCHVKIDWDDFERAAVVDDVDIAIDVEPRPDGRKPGTVIEIRNLVTHFGRMDVKRLARGLILLADPFGDDPQGFLPLLESSEYEDLAKLVATRYFVDADFHLISNVDATGFCSASVLDWRGQELFSAKHDEIATDKERRGRPYGCPPSRFDLWVFILTQTNFSTRSSSLAEVREWLSEFGGVHLYENGLRVAPYGNPGNDWLDLNLSRSRSPEERPSTNTSIGRVAVVDSSGMLLQKTDRSGFIETSAFEELRAFAKDSLEWMARRRLEDAERRRAHQRAAAPTAAAHSKETVEKAIAQAPSGVKKKLSAAFESYDRTRDKQVRSLQQEVQLYRTLSTAGITAATFAHESTGNPLKV